MNPDSFASPMRHIGKINMRKTSDGRTHKDQSGPEIIADGETEKPAPSALGIMLRTNNQKPSHNNGMITKAWRIEARK